MGREILLWILGVPIPIIILLALFHIAGRANKVALNAPAAIGKTYCVENDIGHLHEEWATKEEPL